MDNNKINAGSTKVERVGRGVVKWMLSPLEHYPVTLAAVAVVAALCSVVVGVPRLGRVLQPIAQLAGVGVIAQVFFNESFVKINGGR